MNGLKASAVAVSVVALSLGGSTVIAQNHHGGRDGDREKVKTPASITVAFGTGNNNAQAGNTPNHHIIPQEFKVRITKAKKLDGTVVVVPATVNFIVAGFHWAWVYQAGVKLSEVAAHIPTDGTFVNYEVMASPPAVTPVVMPVAAPIVTNVFAKGVFPGTPPLFADATFSPLASAQNRTDSFAFSTPGRYLVICNVRGHFIDGMYAWVTVVGEDDD